jgi:hypothetical protein
MHECPNCGQACDCIGDDTWDDTEAAECECQCEWLEDNMAEGWEGFYDEIEPNFKTDGVNWRAKTLRPGYELRQVITHGLGVFPVNIETGEVCDCKMVWNEDGTILSCPVCGLDGT